MEEVVIDLRKHVATVPNGFVRYFVLKVLTQKPMSGSQIIAEIEEKTHGAWKPTFGSVYSVLSRLRQDDYIVEMPTEDSYLKPYSLTEEGEKFLQELTKTIAERLRQLESVIRVLCPEIVFLGSD